MPRRLVLAALAALLLVSAACTNGRTPSAASATTVTVMTRNLYLGGDLRLLTRGTTLTQINADIIAVLEQVEASDPPQRMAWVADEIVRSKADLVALQEVATWHILPMPSVPGLERQASYDFLQLLLDALAGHGVRYRVAAAQTNFDTTTELSGIPLPLTYNDRDVILVRQGAASACVVRSGKGTYAAQLRRPVPAIGRTLDFRRGYVWADISSGGHRWRFVDTHAEAYPGLSAATYHDYGADQAAELASALRSVSTPVVVAGDLNSAAGERARKTFAVLVDRGGFADAWAKAGGSSSARTCCHDATLAGRALSERIDHVLVRGAVVVHRVGEVGVTPVAPRPPRWPSDHAGVTATLRIG